MFTIFFGQRQACACSTSLSAHLHPTSISHLYLTIHHNGPESHQEEQRHQGQHQEAAHWAPPERRYCCCPTTASTLLLFHHPSKPIMVTKQQPALLPTPTVIDAKQLDPTLPRTMS